MRSIVKKRLSASIETSMAEYTLEGFGLFYNFYMQLKILETENFLIGDKYASRNPFQNYYLGISYRIYQLVHSSTAHYCKVNGKIIDW